MQKPPVFLRLRVEPVRAAFRPKPGAGYGYAFSDAVQLAVSRIAVQTKTAPELVLEGLVLEALKARKRADSQ